MNNLTLTAADSGDCDFKLRPEGIHFAVCVDVTDPGRVEMEFRGVKEAVNKSLPKAARGASAPGALPALGNLPRFGRLSRWEWARREMGMFRANPA